MLHEHVNPPEVGQGSAPYSQLIYTVGTQKSGHLSRFMGNRDNGENRNSPAANYVVPI